MQNFHKVKVSNVHKYLHAVNNITKLKLNKITTDIKSYLQHTAPHTHSNPWKANPTITSICEYKCIIISGRLNSTARGYSHHLLGTKERSNTRAGHQVFEELLTWREIVNSQGIWTRGFNCIQLIKIIFAEEEISIREYLLTFLSEPFIFPRPEKCNAEITRKCYEGLEQLKVLSI